MAHKQNIFREVISTREVIIEQLRRANPKEYDLVKRKLDAIDELLRDLRSLHWIKHKKAKERLEYYLNHADLNCRTTASRFEVDNVNVIEQTVKYASDKIRPSVDRAISLITGAKDPESIDEAIEAYRESATHPGTYGYFLPGTSLYLPAPKYDPSLSLKDCRKELARLGVYAHFAEYVLTKDCDPEKIAHILALLSTRNGKKWDRDAVKLFFSGEFTLQGQHTITDQLNQLYEWLEEQNPYRNLDWEAEYDASNAD
ncbi:MULTISPECIES: hypothetical protein [Paenibacillaceae]|uniref:Uncharacterized protein n=1 Tax=Paenibacillus thailandensis TaxID=393250 RepID=A0ABW5QR20_9BACL|nr:hypothetical protein [Cohnella massiliensis]